MFKKLSYKIYIIILFVFVSNYSFCNNAKPDSLESEDSYILAAKNYLQLRNINAAENILNIGLQKFANSSIILNDLGEIFYTQNKKDKAIEYWEKGINANNNFKQNYYNAAMYYRQINPLKVAIYAECFLLLKDSTSKAIEMKLALLDAYKKINTQQINIWATNNFEAKFLNSLATNSNFSFSSIKLMRLKSIINWYSQNNENIDTHFLIQKWQSLAANDLFEAYNQSLFNSIYNPQDFKNWYQANKAKAIELNSFLNQ